MAGVRRTIDQEIVKVGKYLDEFGKQVSIEVRDALDRLAEDILNTSNKRCPYETGKLRNSGQAYLVKRGGKDYTLIWQVDGAGPHGGGTAKPMEAPSGTTYRWGLVFKYDRFSDRAPGLDLAVWTHEDMNEEGYFARGDDVEGPGSKYLQTAIEDHAKDVAEELQKSCGDAIKKMKRGR